MSILLAIMWIGTAVNFGLWAMYPENLFILLCAVYCLLQAGASTWLVLDA